MKDRIQREKYVVVHGQTARFRVIKYLILAMVITALWAWKGGIAVAIFLACLITLGTTVHFLFRWKTKAWTQSWGPYKKMELPK